MWRRADLRERMEHAITQGNVTATTLENHVRECDRRYVELSSDQERRHLENSGRMDKQDATLNKLLWGTIVAAGSVVALFLEMLFRNMNVHIGS